MNNIVLDLISGSILPQAASMVLKMDLKDFMECIGKFLKKLKYKRKKLLTPDRILKNSLENLRVSEIPTLLKTKC